MRCQPLTVKVILALSVVCCASAASPPQIQSKAAGSPSAPNEQKESEFRSENSGEVHTADGLDLGFTNYSTTNGMHLKVYYGKFADAVKTKHAMELREARTIRVLESGAKKDEKGNVVGERKVVEFAVEKGSSPVFGVMWTDGLTFHEIRSHDMKSAVELERIYKY